VVRSTKTLLSEFRARGLPVVLVNVAGRPPGRTEQPARMGQPPKGWEELIPELEQTPSDHVVTKRTPGAFTNTGLEEHLKRQGVTQVVVVGVATSNGVEVTARQAFEAGFNVTVATDAVSDANPEAHAYALAKVFPRIGETGTTKELVDLLGRTRE
jgi:nicotinamidase-related amidase